MKHLFFLLVFLILGLQACQKETDKPVVLEFGTVTDVDGNTYKTVKIGNQWWMCENLRVKHFNDGSSISFIGNQNQDTLWAQAIEPAFSYLNDSIFGSYYNYLAVKDVRKLAPEGWHIPTDEEWKTMEKTIGMSENQANALAWRGTNEAEYLINKNSEGWPTGTVPFGLDSYDFGIIPSGCRLFNGELTFGNTAFFWTSTSNTNGDAYYRYFDAQKKNIFRQATYPQYGMSIRCVKD
ncbi:MAG: fibrobacter succinogenes major paralogous domain-containing protein [Flavobacteriia bacterium]